jgi:hypothetical protein
MDEREFERMLEDLLTNIAAMDDEQRDDAGLPDEAANIKRVSSYDSEGMLTRNRGLVVRCTDGSEFQVTIVQSR